MSPLGQLRLYTASQKKRIYKAIGYSIINKVADLAPPALIGLAVDIVVKAEDSFLATLGLVDTKQQLIVLVALTVFVWGVESIYEYAYQVAWRNIAQDTQHQLRVDVYDHVQHLDMGWYANRKSGRLMSIINDDINQLERFLDVGVNDILQVGTTVISVSAAFIYLAPELAMLSCLPIPVILWGSIRFQKRIAPRYAIVREKASLVNAQLSNNLSGMETIKSYTAEPLACDQVSKLSRDYQSANQSAIKLSSAFTPLIRMAIVVGFGATLFYGGLMTLEGEIEVGAYSVMVFLTQRLLWPLTRLGQTMDLYQRSMASAARCLGLLSEESQIHSGPDELQLPKSDIHFDQVSFAYPGREHSLTNIKLTAKGGETTAIVGLTGSGKSTLIRLLLRFYDAQSGEIRIGEQAIQSLQLDSLRSSIGLVSQSVYLFDGTVRENLLYGQPTASTEDLIQATKAAEAYDFIEALPEGFDTLIGERGQKLSGGQRQRLSLARAILKDPPILILDEATSAVDNETEAAIQRSLSIISQNRTTIVIAHRLSTIRAAHQILVLDQGCLVEQGTHSDLIAANGIYSRLWAVQTGHTQE
ncbi:MAG: ABC transporter ATP-binding protein [Myxococcota bacterium]